MCECLRVCEITSRNSQNDPEKPSLKTTHIQWNLYYVCFVLFNSRPPVWGLTDRWNGSWTRARHSQEWDQKVLTHTFLSLCRGALYLSYLQPSWNHLSAELSSTVRWTRAGSTLMKVISGSPCGTLYCRSDNIYTRDIYIWGPINQSVSITKLNTHIYILCEITFYIDKNLICF